MSAEVERLHSSYRVWFDADGIELNFHHLRNGHDALTAEVEVLTTNPAYGPVLVGPKLLNLLSERTQAQWAGTLSGRCPAVSDWHGLMTEACREVLKLHRTGEPSLPLSQIPRPEGGAWLLPGLVLARLPVIWFGDGSAGKSLLALAAAETIRTGRSDLLGLRPGVTANTLWLDWEFDGWEHRNRAAAILGEESELRYRWMSGPLCEQVEALEREIDTYQIGLLVLDSAIGACGGKPEDTEQTGRMFDAIRALRVGALIIAHESKGQSFGISHDKPFGSAFWHNNARATWFVQKQQDEQAADETRAQLHVGMFNKKSNRGRLFKPLGFLVEVRNNAGGDMQSCSFSREDVRDIEGLRASTPVREQIKRQLESGPKTAAALSRELEVKQDTIHKTLLRMEKAKQVVVVDVQAGVNFYGLAGNRIDLDNLQF